MRHRYILHNNFSAEVDHYHKELVRKVAHRFGLENTLVQNIPAHFTLKYWFEADALEIWQLKGLLEIFSDRHRASTVALTAVESFPPNVVFLKVELSDEARQTFDTLIASLRTLEWLSWDTYDAPNLHFHSTIAEECGEQYDAVLEYMQTLKIRDTVAAFDNITVTKQSGMIGGRLPKLEAYEKYSLK